LTNLCRPARYARLHAHRDLFADWTFANLDFEAMPLERDDFVYADPPYDVEFTQYAKDGFAWEDQEVRMLQLS
jgi:DNA adenine methylase